MIVGFRVFLEFLGMCFAFVHDLCIGFGGCFVMYEIRTLFTQVCEMEIGGFLEKYGGFS